MRVVLGMNHPHQERSQKCPTIAERLHVCIIMIFISFLQYISDKIDNFL